MKKNILIISLSFILLIMGIGYSLFSSKLNINSSTSITSNWDVEITFVEKTNVSGNVVEKSKSFTKDSATFNVEMEKPSNYVYYKIGVTNKGSIPAIATLGNLTCTNDAFECGAYPLSNTIATIKENTDLSEQRLVIDTNETEYYNVYIKFKNEVTSMPENLTNTLTLNLTYKQSDVGIVHKDSCYTGKVLKDGTLSITDYDASCGTDVVLPEEIDGYAVTEVASGRWDEGQGKTISPFANKGITSVVLSKNIRYVGKEAFSYNQITSVTLNDGLVEIDAAGFFRNNIKELIIPSSVTTLRRLAFALNDLTEINIPNTVTYLGEGAFTSNKVTENPFIYKLNSDGTYDRSVLNSFAGKDASNIVIPSNITTIGPCAFRNVGGTYLDIPSTVTTISDLAFEQAWISKITLNEGLKTIGYGGFHRNTSLTEISIPNSVETIGANAFEMSMLKKVTIGSGVKSIGNNAFKTENSYNPIETITINQKEGAIAGSPWGSGATINWIG